MNATMINQIQNDEFSLKARAYCAEHGIYDIETAKNIEHALRHKAFIQAIEPINKAKAEVFSLCGFRFL